jgi:hypothetical protein
MNKFVSFEMVFHTGQKYMGNMCIQYSDITCEMDITNVETYIKQKLNVGQDINGLIDMVTVTNWRTL